MEGWLNAEAWTSERLVVLVIVSVLANVLLSLLLLCRKGNANAHVPHPNGRSPRHRGRSRDSGAGRRTPLTTSLADAVAELRTLSEQHRYGEARELLGDVRAAIASGSALPGWGASEAKAKLEAMLADGVLEARIQETRNAFEDLNSDDGFTLVKSEGSMRVSQRFTADRYMTVKVEGVFEGVRPAHCLMIWREVELYPLWFPFVTMGRLLLDRSPGEVWLNISVETFAMDVEMPLWGFASDSLMAGEDGLLLVVRPVRADTALPPGVSYAFNSGGKKRKLFGSLMAYAVIDILVEPLTESSCRFAFQMSDTVPTFVPTWMMNYMVQNAMLRIYDQTQMVATRMARQDPGSEHVSHINRAEYRPTRTWIEDKVSSFLATKASNASGLHPPLTHSQSPGSPRSRHASPKGVAAPPSPSTLSSPSWVSNLLSPCLESVGSPHSKRL